MVIDARIGASPEAGPTGKRVLLVDDDLETRDAVVSLLSDQGYEVYAIGDGRQALEHLRQSPADLIILDLVMPVMDGWQFRNAQRADPQLSDIPVIAVSGDDSAQAAAIHADGYLRKPLSVAALLDAVERILLQREGQKLARKLRDVERMALLGAVAAGVGHEVNNPLTYVIANLDILESDLQELADEPDPRRRGLLLDGARTLVHEIKTGASRIHAVVAGFHRLSHTTAGAEQAVDVRRVLQACLTIASNEIRHRARLRTELAEVPPVRGDESRLAQVFLNLLVNAAQAIAPGAVEANEICVTTTRQGNDVVIEFGDTGGPLDGEAHGRLLERFFITRETASATGLGLAISRGIIAEHRGRMEVQARAEGGRLFRIVLPAEVAVSEQPPAIETGPAPGALRVMVIDDDPPVLAAIERMLRRKHAVIAVGSGGLALRRLADDRGFDAILCDVMMPEMTGMDFYAALAKVDRRLAARIVFMTGGAFAPEARAFLDGVTNRTIAKPFTPDAVSAALIEAAAAAARAAPETAG
jgi:CheY-like chemotaxis protein